MKWIKITADNFTELHIGDKVTKENRDEIANVIAAEPVEESSNEVLHAYRIADAAPAPGQEISLQPEFSGAGALQVTRNELLENWWWLKKTDKER